MSKYTCKVSGGRLSNSYPEEDTMTIRVEDAVSGVVMLDIELGLAAMMKALTGGYVDGTVEVWENGIRRWGMVHSNDEQVVPGTFSHEVDLLAHPLMRGWKAEGWEVHTYADESGRLNPHRKVGEINPKTKTAQGPGYRVTRHRWDPPVVKL